MKIVDFLKKIGVIRTWSKSGSYTEAKDRPDQFVEKDLHDGAQTQVYDDNVENN